MAVLNSYRAIASKLIIRLRIAKTLVLSTPEEDPTFNRARQDRNDSTQIGNILIDIFNLTCNQEAWIAPSSVLALAVTVTDMNTRK